jgi:hypothetical protein
VRSDIFITIVLAILIGLAFGLYEWVGSYAEPYFTAEKLTSRFPEKELSYSSDQLGELVTSNVRNSYVFPILFPLDLLVMLALSASMGAACWYWTRQVYPAAACLVLLVPIAYLVSDLGEDILLAWLLWRGDASIAAASTPILKIITTIKLATIVGSMALTAIAFVAWLVRLCMK